jgi:hypothetical protein
MSADIPTYDLTRKECGKDSVSCFAGNDTCVARATNSGLVPYARHGSTFEYCTPDALGTRPTGLGLIALGVVVAAVALVLVIRRRRHADPTKRV